MSEKLLSLAREVGAEIQVVLAEPYQAVFLASQLTAFAERIRQDEREKALSIESISEAVRAYVQAGKRGEDLLGAMRCAIEAAIRSSGTSGSKGEADE